MPTVWITETQKVYARVHKINDDLLHDLIYQKILNKDVNKGIMATILKSEKGKTITFPKQLIEKGTRTPPGAKLISMMFGTI